MHLFLFKAASTAAMLALIVVNSAIGECREPAGAMKPSSPSPRLVRALSRSGNFRFHKTPLGEVCEFMETNFQIDVRVDRPSLVEFGYSVNTPVTLHASGITLRSALTIIVEQTQLGWIISDEALLITSPRKAERNEVRVHPVADLLGLTDEWEDEEALAELIMMTVAPSSWDAGTGPPSVWIPAFNKTLVFPQMQRVHEETARLLSALRKAQRQSGGLIRVVRPAQLRREKKILSALDQTTTTNFKDVPLRDAAPWLARSWDIDMVIDLQVVTFEAKSLEMKTTLQVSGMSRLAALNLLLRQAGLDWIIRNEVIYIIDEPPESYHELVVYPVQDLLKPRPKELRNAYFDSYEDIIDSLGLRKTATVGFGRALVCLQSRRDHVRTSKLLADLRMAQQQASCWASKRDSVVRRFRLRRFSTSGRWNKRRLPGGCRGRRGS